MIRTVVCNEEKKSHSNSMFLLSVDKRIQNIFKSINQRIFLLSVD